MAEKEDLSWIRDRLGERRGMQADLARFIGLDTSKLNKVLAGNRQLQHAEKLKVMEYFGISDPSVGPLTPRQKELLELSSQLSAEALEFLIKSARAQLPDLGQAPQQSDEADE